MNEQSRNQNQRVVTFLNRDEVDYLDKLGKMPYFHPARNCRAQN